MKVVILDDHSLFSEGLGKILEDNFKDLEIDIFNSIANLTHGVLDFSSCQLIISDIELPGEDIFTFLTSLKSDYPDTPVLIISMHNKLSVIKKCKELNIEGYILKDDHEFIIEGIQEILAGKEYYSEKVQQTLNILNKQEKLLTPKEEEIIALLAKGKNNRDIAIEIFVSYNTIKTHRKNISRKLQLSSTAEIIQYYYKNYI
ncbi:MAG: response regulator transcription factor [Bacteroidetes bacterium]|nr:response regulator transcription factor [Bacteroidota bacterium]